MHYTTHIKGVWHPEFMKQREEKWFYHDRIRASMYNEKIRKGIQFENTSNPKLSLSILNDELKPYILIYCIEKIEQ